MDELDRRLKQLSAFGVVCLVGQLGAWTCSVSWRIGDIEKAASTPRAAVDAALTELKRRESAKTELTRAP